MQLVKVNFFTISFSKFHVMNECRPPPWNRYHPSPFSELKERKRKRDWARAAAMAVAGKSACGEVGETARRKAERRSILRDD